MDLKKLKKKSGTKKQVKEEYKKQRSQVSLGKKLGTKTMKSKKDYNRSDYKKIEEE